MINTTADMVLSLSAAAMLTILLAPLIQALRR